MPNGFGYSDGGARVRRLERALTGLKAPGRDPNALADEATTAVLRIARASGHPLPPPPKVSGGGGSETRDRVVIAAAVLVALAAAAAVALVRRARTRPAVRG